MSGVKLLGVQPDHENIMTYMEFPAFEEDWQHTQCSVVLRCGFRIVSQLAHEAPRWEGGKKKAGSGPESEFHVLEAVLSPVGWGGGVPYETCKTDVRHLLSMSSSCNDPLLEPIDRSPRREAEHQKVFPYIVVGREPLLGGIEFEFLRTPQQRLCRSLMPLWAAFPYAKLVIRHSHHTRAEWRPGRAQAEISSNSPRMVAMCW